MGDPTHPDVIFLRALRDEWLSATPRGARLAERINRFYYRFSPAIARYLDGHLRSRTLVRVALIKPLVVALRCVLAALRRVRSKRGTSKGGR